MTKMIKVIALKAFDNGFGIVKKGTLIDIPANLFDHYSKHGKVALEAKTATVKAKVAEVKAKVEEVKEVIKKTKRKRKS